MIEHILTPQVVEALGWTLLHSLWQGAAFAIILALLFIALRSYAAQSRYIVAVGLLSAFFLTVASTFWLQWQEASTRFEATDSNAIAVEVDADSSIPLEESSSAVAIIDDNIQPSQGTKVSMVSHTSWLTTFQEYYQRHLPLLVTIWLMGVLFLQLRFLGQLAYVQRLKHYGTQLFPLGWKARIEALEGKLRIRKKVAYLTSLRIESPMVIGWLKPVVLVPTNLFQRLTETEIYAVLAHELAHIRREDFIVNLLQTFLCNVFFFHPGVWWMSGRVDDEREHCCDDLAVDATGQATSYAKTLINISALNQSMVGGTPALALAIEGPGKKKERGGFGFRIKRLFKVPTGAGTYGEGFATACILFAALIFGVAATGYTSDSQDTLSKVDIDPIEKLLEKSSTTNENLKKTKIVDGRRVSNITEPSEAAELPESHIDIFPLSDLKNYAVANNDARIDALVMACGEGDLEFVQTLIKSGIDINRIDQEGFTPLMMATSENQAEIVSYLLKNGADVNLVSGGWTALIEAADQGSLESMKLLIDAGAEVNYYAGMSSPTAITMAASEGKLESLKLLIDNGADINGYGKSMAPLHIAAEENKTDVIDYLVSKNVKVNNRDASGRTALMYAAAEGNKQAVIKLIEAGADISMVDQYGATASVYAEDEDENHLLHLLRMEGRPKIHEETFHGHIERVQRMVEKGADVNERDNYGRTPLHIATIHNHTLDMRVLIDLGAEVNGQDYQGRTALMYAAKDSHSEAVALLVSKLADVNIQDEEGMRAYELAKQGGNSDLVNFLGLITEDVKLRNIKVDPNTNSDLDPEELEAIIDEALENVFEKDLQKEIREALQKNALKDAQKKETVHVTKDGLHLKQYDITESPEFLNAVRNGSLVDCQKLVEAGADVNAADDTGQTALMVASMSNRLEKVKFLIANGADVNASSSSGLTALHYTALENHYQIAQILIENKAKVDAEMKYSSTDGSSKIDPVVWEYIGATPLLIAVESDHLEVAAILIDAGANPNHQLDKNEYRMKRDGKTYLTRIEVVGMDDDFLKNAEVIITEGSWTPLKQAAEMNSKAMLGILSK